MNLAQKLVKNLREKCILIDFLLYNYKFNMTQKKKMTCITDYLEEIEDISLIQKEILIKNILYSIDHFWVPLLNESFKFEKLNQTVWEYGYIKKMMGSNTISIKPKEFREWVAKKLISNHIKNDTQEDDELDNDYNIIFNILSNRFDNEDISSNEFLDKFHKTMRDLTGAFINIYDDDNTINSMFINKDGYRIIFDINPKFFEY